MGSISRSPLGFGAHCVVVPHFDNAEGGTHDTRFCYMGERRLAVMEELLPADAGVLGVDEHTALVFDLDAGDLTVTGRGVVTVRRRGVAERFPAGTRMPITSLVAAARGARESGGAAASPADTARAPAESERTAPEALGAPRRGRARSSRRLRRRLPRGGRGRPPRRSSPSTGRSSTGRRTRCKQTSPTAHGRCSTRWCIAWAKPPRSGLRDPKEALAPLVERLIVLRAELRNEKAWQLADRLRDRLVAAGIELHDTPGGTTWTLRE